MVISRLLPYLSRCTTLQVLKFSGAVEAGQMTSILQKLDFPELSIREILLLDCSSAFQIPHFRSFISFRNLLRFDFQSCDELEIDDEEFAEVVRHLPLLEYLHMSRGGIDDEVDYELVENRLTLRALDHLVVSCVHLKSVDLVLSIRFIPILIPTSRTAQRRGLIDTDFVSTYINPQMDIQPWLLDCCKECDEVQVCRFRTSGKSPTVRLKGTSGLT